MWDTPSTRVKCGAGVAGGSAESVGLVMLYLNLVCAEKSAPHRTQVGEPTFGLDQVQHPFSSSRALTGGADEGRTLTLLKCNLEECGWSPTITQGVSDPALIGPLSRGKLRVQPPPKNTQR